MMVIITNNADFVVAFPIYFFNCGFKLGFHKNDTYYSESLWCVVFNFKYTK